MVCSCRAIVVAVAIMLATAVLAAARGASELTPDRVNKAEFSGKPPSPDTISPVTIKAQILLDRARFSPGEIDGKLGENTKKALRAYADANDLASTTELTPDLWQKLAADTAPALTQYTISDEDLRGPFLAKMPAKLSKR